jgi:hypothetical protein
VFKRWNEIDKVEENIVTRLMMKIRNKVACEMNRFMYRQIKLKEVSGN